MYSVHPPQVRYLAHQSADLCDQQVAWAATKAAIPDQPGSADLKSKTLAIEESNIQSFPLGLSGKVLRPRSHFQHVPELLTGVDQVAYPVRIVERKRRPLPEQEVDGDPSALEPLESWHLDNLRVLLSCTFYSMG